MHVTRSLVAYSYTDIQKYFGGTIRREVAFPSLLSDIE